MLLKVDALLSGYGHVEILHGVDLHVDGGEIVAILGRNGVGKTTLMRALSGSLKCKSGRLIFDGHDIAKLPPHERARMGIAFVPQGRQIFGQLTVQENILVGLYAAGLPQQEVAGRLEEILLELPTLKAKLKDLGASLSGGQQQLLALARALINRPRLLLLDEPSEGIQPSLLDDIADVIARFSHKQGLSVLLVEQNLDFAGELAKRAYLMDTGRIYRSVAMDECVGDSDLYRELFGATV